MASVTDTSDPLSPTAAFLTEAIAFQFSSATLSAISHSPDGFFFGNFLRVMVLPEAEM